MSRDERPSRAGSASELDVAREGAGFESTEACEEIRFGCSMLSRIRPRGRNASAFAPMRCSLGFALHAADDVARCRAVEGPGECWKTAPSWRVPEPPPRERATVVAGAVQVAIRTTEVVVELVQARVTTSQDAAPDAADGNGTDGADGV